MKQGQPKIPGAFWGLCITCILLTVGGLAYSLLVFKAVPAKILVDYNTVTIVLLTTVTVVFSFAAIVLAVLGYVGYNNLINEAGRKAEQRVLDEIDEIFGASGSASEWLESQIQKPGGEYRKFLESQIRSSVFQLMPIVLDKMEGLGAGLADGESTDEGSVD